MIPRIWQVVNFHHIANMAAAILMHFLRDRTLNNRLPSGYSLGLLKLLWGFDRYKRKRVKKFQMRL